MNTKMYTYHPIMDGPSIDRLFDACKYAYSISEVKIDFSVRIGKTIASNGDPGRSLDVLAMTSDWKVVAIEHEDGSGESFNLKGYCSLQNTDPTSNKPVSSQVSFVAFYQPKTRQGQIKFLF